MNLNKKRQAGLFIIPMLFSYTVPAFAAEVTTDGKVEFEYSSDDPKVVDPDKNDPTIVIPEVPKGTSGQLRINQFPTLEFGKVILDGSKIDKNARYTKLTNYEADGTTIKDENYVPNFLQVNDTRGETFGWSVSLSASSLKRYDMNGDAVANSEVENAKIIFNTPRIISNSGVTLIDRYPVAKDHFELNLSDENSTQEIVFNTDENTKIPKRGYGIWSVNYGDEVPNATSETAPDNIKLEIPASSSKSEGIYKTLLTWTITQAP